MQSIVDHDIYFLKLVIITFIVLLCIIKSSHADSGPFTYPGNGHNYTRYDIGSGNYMNANMKCAMLDFYGGKNYAATFTTKEEFDWAVSVGLINNIPVFIGGTLSGGKLMFGQGPETGQLLYDIPIGRPYSFYQPIPEYTFPSSEMGQLYALFDGNVSFQGFQPFDQSLTSVICETGGVTDPILSQLDTIGGVLQISGLTGYNLSALTVTFTSTNLVDPTPSFGCVGSITKTSSSQVNCTVAPGTGSYNVQVTDGKKTSVAVVWSFNTPYLKSIYPSLTAGTLFTIYGDNFGDNATKIKVYLTSDMILCSVQEELIPGKAYTLTYDIPLTQQLLPITIIVDNVRSFLNQVPICKDSSSYSFFTPYTPMKSFVAFSNRIVTNVGPADEGIEPALGVIEFAATANLLIASYPKFYTPGRTWATWEDLAVTYPTNSFTRYTNREPIVPYNSTIVDVSQFNANGYLYFDFTNATIYRDSTINLQALVQHIPLVYLATDTAIRANTTGLASVKLNLTSYGSRFASTQLFFVNGTQVLYPGYNPVTNYGNIVISIPEGYDSIPYAVKTDSRWFNTTITYNPPKISSVSTTGTVGGAITITGTNFYKSNQVVSVSLLGKPCSTPTITSPHTEISCVVPAGSGSGNVVVTVGMQPSSSVPWQYNAPTITGVLASGNPSLLDITGTNFFNVANRIRVYASVPTRKNVQCTGVSVTTAHTRLGATVPKSMQGRTVNVSLTVSNTASNPFAVDLPPYLDSVDRLPYTEGSDVQITAYFDTVDKSGNNITSVQVFINGTTTYIDCPVRSLPPTAAILNCTIPPGFFQFSVRMGSPWGQSNLLAIKYAPPTVVSASPVKYEIGGLVTVSGNSFGNLTQPPLVWIGNYTNMISCTNATLLDPFRIECHYTGSVPAPADKTRSLNVTVTSTFGSATKEVFIYSIVLSCQNNCSGHGVCNTDTGNCQCDIGYRKSADCSIADAGNGGKPETSENGTTVIPVEGLNFTIAITHLREIDIDGVPIKTLPLADVEWDTELLDNDTMLHNGNFSYDSALISIISTYFADSTTITFAGQDMVMPANSIKYEITVANWTWAGPLSQLQVVYNSATDHQSMDGCQLSETNVTTSNDGDSIYWFQISSGKTVMNAKFANRLIVDDRVIRSSVKLLDKSDELYKNITSQSDKFNLLTAMTTPYFSDKVVLDPSFSALLKYRQDESSDPCSVTDEVSNWKIIVISVCGGIGLLAVASVSAIAIKRYRVTHGAKQKLNRLAKMNQNSSHG
ncbi:hypothetical protein DFA_00265 [Cavenderia fasciculata]|uniref:EGF-like domain-containing protein n=1 Tax=Cavenderia fasciculata TaxID=261658 RepID=F4PY27_CACFS|nr:uncharacterized protein DFA_00265 [Cavenderia fasciculata]EGG19687.1 hypothetical protein DFA_00265 [Cavenderia fasciculata]|eukprot:XP_004357981.1 hypothetical protein DFA_00265 [Cavenderia fasciculata]